MTCNTAVFGELRTINVYVLYAMELPRRNLTIVSAIAFLETSVWIEGTHAHHAEETRIDAPSAHLTARDAERQIS
jgi:hypothetical protein